LVLQTLVLNRIDEIFALLFEIINLIMKLCICVEQVFQCLVVLLARLLSLVSKVLFQKLRARSLRYGRLPYLHGLQLLLLLTCLIRHDVVADLREVGFEFSELLNEQFLDGV
jgi:hypothetical protein